MKKIIAVLGVCLVAAACGGNAVDALDERHHADVDDTPMDSDDMVEEATNDDVVTIKDPEPETATDPELDVRVPVIRPIGEDPSEEDEALTPIQKSPTEPESMGEEPEALAPVATDPPLEMPEPTTAPVEEPEVMEPEAEPYQLVVQFHGPPSAEVMAGADNYASFLFSLTATQEDLEIEMLPMQIGCDAGRIYGSDGTPYFTDIKVTDVETGVVVAGPRELASPTDGMEIVSSWFVFGSPFVIPAGTTRSLAIRVDTAMAEDAPGEFFGNACRVTLTSLEGAVSVGSPPEALPNEAINITTDIVGNAFVVRPNASTNDEGVTVALSPTTPAGFSVLRNSTYVSLLDVTFTAGDVAESISVLRFSRLGDGVASDFYDMFLFDEQGNRLTLARTIDPETDIVVFNGLDIAVPANTTVLVSLVGTLSKPEILGGQHAFELWDAEDVTLNGSGPVHGSFPVRGNTFTVSENEDIFVSSCEVFPYVVPTQSVSRGVEAPISTLAFTASSGDMEVLSVVLTQAGTISESGLSDFRVYVGSTLVAAIVTVMDGRIRVELESPLVVADGTSSFLTLRALVGGEVGDTIRTYIEYPVDLVVRDPLYQMYSESIISAFDGSSSSTSVEVTVQ